MSKAIVLIFTAAVAIVGFDSRTSAYASEIGRYQLAASMGTPLFVIDTATGQCWSRTADGEWRDEGNPAQSRSRKLSQKRESSVPKLELPEKSVNLVVMQHEERAIPGSDGSVRIRLGDITDGQVFLSVGTKEEDNLLERTSVAAGDTVRFTVGKREYTIHIDELRNILIGDDFAKITAAESPDEEDKPKLHLRGSVRSDISQ